ncbi:MAG: (4Fe-4S)-binding protein, partial [Desulfocapsa sp.]|nr:(4Fe-4S)-binding protein [Desulfocapsa sp.]
KVTNNLSCLVCGHCLQLCPNESPQLNVRHPLSELIIRKGKMITCTLMVPFLMGSQLARFLDQNIFHLMEKIELVCMYSWVCQMGLYAIPLAIGFAIVHVTISYGDLFFGVYHDDLMGRFSPMIPILLPLALAGELVSRLNYTVRHFPEFLPTLGRQFGWGFLERLTFVIPEWVYPSYGIFFIFLSEVAGLYLLQKFYVEECDGIISLWKYRAIQVAFFTLFGIYVCLMSTGWNIPSLNVMLLFQ